MILQQKTTTSEEKVPYESLKPTSKYFILFSALLMFEDYVNDNSLRIDRESFQAMNTINNIVDEFSDIVDLKAYMKKAENIYYKMCLYDDNNEYNPTGMLDKLIEKGERFIELDTLLSSLKDILSTLESDYLAHLEIYIEMAEIKTAVLEGFPKLQTNQLIVIQDKHKELIKEMKHLPVDDVENAFRNMRAYAIYLSAKQMMVQKPHVLKKVKSILKKMRLSEYCLSLFMNYSI
jgi:hypothetical protein